MKERLEPLGASDEELIEECRRCLHLEEEKETLQSSLFALTTHLAQVQFRLRQVCDASFEDQEELLKSLEEFAFVDVNLLDVDDDMAEVVRKRRHQQKVLVGKLKTLVKELKGFHCELWREEGSLEGLMQHLRVKEEVERQLRGQIGDLERFVEYLKSVGERCCCKQRRKTLKGYAVESFTSFLQIFTLIHFTLTSCFMNRPKIDHWGDLRARLELAIIDLTKLVRNGEDPKRITLTVRQTLAVSLRDLIQHGTKFHSWEIILYYYNLKKGDEFNSSALQKLSRSFNIEIAGVSPNRNKKNLLCTVEQIVSTYSRYKRSHDSHFKAFVCAALNAGRLATWLGLIFACGEIVRNFYSSWSYVATTRYQDGVRSLEMLRKYKFQLPVDLDVRKFQVEDAVSFE